MPPSGAWVPANAPGRFIACVRGSIVACLVRARLGLSRPCCSFPYAAPAAGWTSMAEMGGITTWVTDTFPVPSYPAR